MKSLKRVSAVIILCCLSGFSSGYADEPSPIAAAPGQGHVKGLNEDMGMNPNHPQNRAADIIIAESPDAKMAKGPLSRPEVVSPIGNRECPGPQCARPEEPAKLALERNQVMVKAVGQVMQAEPVAKKNRQIENTGIDRRFQNLARPE